MNQTTVFITPHGANITNIIWMNPKSIVIEVFQVMIIDPFILKVYRMY